MATLNKFGIRGLRSFGYERQLVPISKLNVYVGKNSCGKSTFLRTFPLLRQSMESNTRFPVLWYAGREGYVDFGDFDTALHDGGDSIYFDFEMSLTPAEAQLRNMPIEYASHYYSHFEGQNFDIDASVNLKRENGELVTTVTFNAQNNSVTLVYSGDVILSLEAKNKDADISETIPLPLKIVKGSLIPRNAVQYKEITHKIAGVRLIPVDVIKKESTDAFSKFILKFHHTTKKLKNISSSLEHIQLCEGENLYKALKSAFPNDRVFLRNLEDQKKNILDISFMYLFLRNIGSFWWAADELFKRFYGGVRYLGPLRASAERFYRFQDLQIGEVDHTGSNLPMVINSLPESKKKTLSDWVKESFGFELLLESTGIHYALLIKEDSDSEYHNVSDMGFGYSQILPVIVSVWLELTEEETPPTRANFFKSRASRTIVIEQPELHLHPALQYKFGLAIAKVINLAKDRDYNFIIETHSKPLIDAIGESISSGVILESDVNIALFEKDSKGLTTTSLASFDAEGYLVNWPAGFLSV